MNKKTPTQLMINQDALRPVPQRPQLEDTVDELGRLIARSLADNLPMPLAGKIIPWLRTAAGAQAIRDSWPRIVDAYFSTLSRRT